jgi:hypothetical protein
MEALLRLLAALVAVVITIVVLLEPMGQQVRAIKAVIQYRVVVVVVVARVLLALMQ